MNNFISRGVLLAGALVVMPLGLLGCASGTAEQRGTGQVVDDSTITAKVKAKLFQDPDTSGFQINVTTFQGVVQLSGFVNDDKAKSRAEELAKNTADVRKVENSIQIKPAS